MTSLSAETTLDAPVPAGNKTATADNSPAQMSSGQDTTQTQEQPSKVHDALLALKKYATFAQLLRMGGAIGVVAAMSLFLLQGFDVANDLQRYLTLLGQTMVLTAAGFMVSFLLKDNKGARVFFGLGLISVPVNFAVLGAMLYSLVSLDVQNVVYPAMVGWHIAGFGQLGIAALAGAAVLIPVTFFGFAVMARPNARLLGALSLMSSLALLIPVRETAWVALIAIAVIYSAITMLKRSTTDASRLKTPEGRFAQALVFVAPVLMVARSIALYSADIYAALVLAAMIYMILRFSATRFDANSLLTKVSCFLAVPVAFVAASLIGIISADSISSHLQVPLVAMVFAGLMLELNRTVENPRISSALVLASGGIILALANVSFVLGSGGLSTTVAGLLTLTVAVYAIFQRRKFLSIAACALLIPHAFSHLLELWAMVDFGNWITLAVLGITAIVGASLLDRFGATWAASREKRQTTRIARQAAEKALELEQAEVKKMKETAALAID